MRRNPSPHGTLMNSKSLLFAMGAFLLFVGVNMMETKVEWNETVLKPRMVPGTKAASTAIGAGVGAVGGGVGAAALGGIGVVLAGTGVGLPAGAALIAVSAAVGATAGGVTGAAMGSSPCTVMEISTVPHSIPAYARWHWVTVTTFGFLLILLALPRKWQLQGTHAKRETP
jgi:hypothetical protein